ncbi:tRNA (adenosine(37)-N6)-threonylcarbamoyltransferase complex transferase subunit TsaD [Fervidibacillus halotolerans]|uniref:tRNA N6-adenosine threonylcarbamoyltransferase n=1 Tax=Fervidibacillus halotolerans TaxID=2980027 RepID=A0A9E8RY80_9BACI|nr:tRNA (adenosine(37)-N6)-threonylcarbamoyltransferase complex transferase subunit TsaD [Fervidibacillus halotolerans]WAA12571.1 tRNA (adenosine(37)-N6)-threonylcarbamoyltransferase complex transferase subunit TsaD [Fervidibacillus halotolerans]
MNDQYILGIETSCDETAAAVVKNGTVIMSNVVASQIESHKRFGGVVPEIASRHHVEQIIFVIEEAMEKANVKFSDLTGIAVTSGPGLVGALLIGVETAKTLAFAHSLPLIPVHHIAGHIYANRLVAEMEFPLVALVVSGGHTELIYMKDHGHFQVIGETRDDAAGEAYDKVARLLDLPYPGGPHIDRLAAKGQVVIDFPRAWLEDESFDFSFSGLKSAVINTVHNAHQRGVQLKPEDVAASFQDSVTEVLVKKTILAAEKFGAKQILLAGGVAANRGLRNRLSKAVEDFKHLQLIIPPLHLCTDNAAMIAAAGSVFYEKGIRADLSLNANPGLSLSRFSTEP